jgi:hypothetical protein
MALIAAFIFVAPNADPSVHRSWVKTPEVEVLTVAVSSYQAAEALVPELIAKEGVGAIELCGGFGHEGLYRIKKAAAGKAAVGAVRFDAHPGLGFKSGDELF